MRDDRYFDDRRGFEPPPRFDDRGEFDGGVGNTIVDLGLGAAQLALLFAVLAAPKIPNGSSVAAFIGLFCIASGGILAVNGALELGARRNYGLQTGGVFSSCRHPVYAGMISASVGIGFWSTSTEQLLSRLLLTGVLCCLLWYKANREEIFLEERYGAQYYDWAASVPRFFPVPGRRASRFRDDWR